MSKITKTPVNALADLPTEVVWQEFRDALAMTETGLRRAAVAFVELKRRGEDVSVIVNSPWLRRLPDIATGKLDPRVLLCYGQDVTRIDAVASLPPKDQRRLVDDPDIEIPVVVAGEKGATVHKLTVSAMTRKQVSQVFAGGKINAPAEQLAHISPPAARKPVKAETSLDLRPVLAWVQIEQLESAAAARGMSPVDFVVDILVRNKIIQVARAVRRRA